MRMEDVRVNGMGFPIAEFTKEPVHATTPQKVSMHQILSVPKANLQSLLARILPTTLFDATLHKGTIRSSVDPHVEAIPFLQQSRWRLLNMEWYESILFD